jgi:hypothetical protein
MPSPSAAPHIRKLRYISGPTIPNCIFCGANPRLTQEHIFSKWLHRYLPAIRAGSYESIRGARKPEESEHHVIKRPGDIRDWQIRCVCEKTCNNGWMRKLVEDRARLILIPLVKGESVRITPSQQQIIAAWATMKAMVAEWNIRDHATTNHMQRKRMMWRQLPPQRGWGVWIGKFVSDTAKPETQRYHPKWESHPFLLLPDEIANERATKEATHFNSQASTQVIGQLFIHVFRSPMPNLIRRWTFTLPDKGSLFRIWPPSQVSIMWPGQAMTDLDATYTANAFMNFVLKIQRRELLASDR